MCLRALLGHAHLLCALSLLCAAEAALAQSPSHCSPALGRVVSLQGTIELLRSGATSWQRLERLDVPVCRGDRLRAGLFSRAALYIHPETVVRLDQNSMLEMVDQTEAETVMVFHQDDVIRRSADQSQSCGVGYFITRFPRKLRVRTPFYNAVVEGTEFQVAMTCDRGELAVFEGKVAAEALTASNDRVLLESGQRTSVGIGEAPSAVRAIVRQADAVQWALYYLPLTDVSLLNADALAQDCSQLGAEQRGACVIRRAEYLLRVGRAPEARVELAALLRSEPNNGDVLALESIVAVVQNDKIAALELAQRAVAAAPNAFRPHAALSYAQQASFKLEDAFTAARRAAELAPDSALLRARTAELQLSLGRVRSAEREAMEAVRLNPNESRAHLILGFVHLAQIDTKKATADFTRAIQLDSTEPLVRLGLGLATIREGRLQEGREQIEIAVALDPTNSLVRSYVGKAYYEENTSERDQLAATQFGLAKTLDSNDPTPWFYDAILKQTQNRPVEALEGLQTSIALNDNRAVYRSRFSLDQDSASRNVSLARGFAGLGFRQRGLSEAYRSLILEPSNHSAHRFLSDSYSALPRHEIAETSEMLQAQLRQPLSREPVLLQRNLADLRIPQATSLFDPGLHEMTRLFDSQGAAGVLDGLAAEHRTFSTQAAIAVLGDRAFAQAGVYKYRTHGFRDNNDIDRTVASTLFQVAPMERISAQMELRTSQFEYGDLPLRFDPDFVLDTRHLETSTSIRLGARYLVRPGNEFIFSTIHHNGENEVSIGPFALVNDLDSLLLEGQWALQLDQADVVLGAGWLSGDLIETFGFSTNPEQEQRQHNEYIYATFHPNAILRAIQLGISLDSFEQPAVDRAEVNPKLGILVSPRAGTDLRMAYLRSLRRILPTYESIEPTQVAGFNQLFNDPEGTISRRWGIGLDQRLSSRSYVGVEYSERNLTVPVIDFFLATSRDVTWTESLARGYLYLSLHSHLALTAEIFYEKYNRPPTDSGEEQLVRLRSWRVPIGLIAFLGNNWILSAAITWWSQEGSFISLPSEVFEGDERFLVMDAGLTYRLPGRKGIVSVTAANLFSVTHAYQETDLFRPQYIPDRTIRVKINLSF